MNTSKRFAVIAVTLSLACSIGVGLAQRSAPHDGQVTAPTDEVEHLRRLLALQEQQLDLTQQQIQLTEGRIRSISNPGRSLAMVEVEMQVVEIVSDEPAVLQELLGVPNPGSEFGVVLDGTKYDELMNMAKSVNGASVVTRPKVAVRAGGEAEIANITSVPFFTLDGDIEFASVGFRGRFQPTVVSEGTLVLRMELEETELVGQSTVAAPDGSTRKMPTVAGRSATMHATLEKSQGVVRSWTEAQTGQTYRSVLYFARPRILTPEEMKGPF